MNKLKHIYEKQYKKLLVIPFALLFLAFVVISLNVIKTGEVIDKGISLKGGTSVTIQTSHNLDTDLLENKLNERFPDSEIRVITVTRTNQQRSIVVETTLLNENELLDFLKENIPDMGDDYSIQTIGPSLGASFFRQTLIAIAIAFVFMSIVVFLYFRTFAPSSAVILAAFTDMVVTLAVLILLDINLTTASVAAFLMVIGYSVDTDVLLCVRLLKRKYGTVFSRTLSSMGTGLLMSLTTLTAVTIAFVFSQAQAIKQIMIVLIIALIVDLFTTWFGTAGIVRWYLERKKSKKA
jgi:preprotein translocase subunit SecF